ncbi:hypothetical protein, partial [Escherichia coli]
MPGQPIPSELREKGLIWLLPPYCWSHRQIARKLKISASVVSKWRCELVEQGLLPEWICPYISRHLLSLNPLLACCRRYSRG